jgi:hypothetical protein
MYDDPNALGGRCIFVGEYNNSIYNLSTEGGIASNIFTVHKKAPVGSRLV